MTKLTTSLRAAIVENALEKAGITKARSEYSLKRQAWATAVADASLGGPEVRAQLEARVHPHPSAYRTVQSQHGQTAIDRMAGSRRVNTY